MGSNLNEIVMLEPLINEIETQGITKLRLKGNEIRTDPLTNSIHISITDEATISRKINQ